MIYISKSINVNDRIAIGGLDCIIVKLKSRKYPDVDYYVYTLDGSFCVVGVISFNGSNCIIDLHNTNVQASIFFNWLRESLSKYDDYYCVPNNEGKFVWQALGLKQKDLYLKFTTKKIFRQKLKARYLKFLFLNMFFEVCTEKTILKLKKNIYYKGQLPVRVELDTF